MGFLFDWLLLWIVSVVDALLCWLPSIAPSLYSSCESRRATHGHHCNHQLGIEALHLVSDLVD